MAEATTGSATRTQPHRETKDSSGDRGAGGLEEHPKGSHPEVAETREEALLFGDKPRPRSILIAVDASHGSVYALQFAVSTIATRSDTIVLLHAYDDVEIMLYPYGSASVQLLGQAQKREQFRSEELLKRLADPLEKLQVKVQTLSVMGDARDALQDAARRLKPDFVILGSHGYGMVKRTLLGSVSDYATHHLECPVLIVKCPTSKQT